jgi:hypothetical protein
VTDTKEGIRQTFASRCYKAQQAIDAATSQARTARDLAIGRAHMEYTRTIDEAMLAYDSAIKEAVSDRMQAMRKIMALGDAQPST